MWFQFECVLNMYQVRNPCSEMSVEPMDAMEMGFMYGVLRTLLRIRYPALRLARE